MQSTRDKPAPPTSEDELPARVLRRFRVVFNAVQNHFRKVERKAGVSGAQAWALAVIGARPGIGVGELARAMRVHQSTASNLLRGLAEQELVRSQRAVTDRRAVELHLTARGRRVLGKAPQPLTGLLPAALERLAPATLTRLSGDLGKLVRELGADPGGQDILIGAEAATERAPARRPRGGSRRA